MIMLKLSFTKIIEFYNFELMSNFILTGDSYNVLKGLKSNSVHGVVTDPPYGISFMSKEWDKEVPNTALWLEVYRVLRHGGHILCFTSTRTIHKTATELETAGFRIIDTLTWLYGQGSPKIHDLSKAADKHLGIERPKVPATGGLHSNTNMNDDNWKNIGSGNPLMDSNEPISDLAKELEGKTTTLKPAQEFIILAQKPTNAKTIVENYVLYQTGGLNTKKCSVPIDLNHEVDKRLVYEERNVKGGKVREELNINVNIAPDSRGYPVYNKEGRYPANVLLSDCEEVKRIFPYTKSGSVIGGRGGDGTNGTVSFRNKQNINSFPSSEGSAARYFNTFSQAIYQSKPSQHEKHFGVKTDENPKGNDHPTVKPIKLIEWLIELITDEGQTVLDPFCGSGTTAIAAYLTKRNFIVIDLEKHYTDIALQRLDATLKYNNDTKTEIQFS